MTQALRYLMLLTAALLALPSLAFAQSAAEQKEAITKLKQEISESSKLFKAGDLDESANKIRAAQEQLLTLAQPKEGKDIKAHKSFLRLLQPLHQSIQRAHGLLELEGIVLDPLPPWKEILDGKVEMAKPEATGVSFSEKLAPWFVSMCGRCHVDGRRGNYSMASYEAIMAGSTAGKVVFPGDSKGSRLVEVIESGDMPRGGGKVSPEQLADLKKWIDEGAKYDGEDAAAPIRSLVKNADPNMPANAGPQLVMATGEETISFARDVAPLLVENCSGCHINAMRSSGNLSLNNFTQLLRGGDSGAIVAPGKAEDSLLIKKLRGTSGQRMPAGGRPALSEEAITKIATWINEGSKFDGAGADSGIEQVVNEAWAAKATHEEVREKRWARAESRWKLVLPDQAPQRASNDEILVLGNIGEKGVQRVLQSAQESLPLVRKALKIQGKEPLVKGGIVFFVFDKHYDYGEFGKMTESRSLPSSWTSHWRNQVLDAYGAIAYSGSLDTRELDGQVLQSLTALHLSSHRAVPFWFAEGVARQTVATEIGKEDPRVLAWQQSAPVAISQLGQPDRLLNGQLDEEQSALVGMRLIQLLSDTGNRRGMDLLLKQLHSGTPFPQAMQGSVGSPEAFVRAALGIPKR